MGGRKVTSGWRAGRLLVLSAALIGAAACSGATTLAPNPPNDAGTGADGGVDAGTGDGGLDAGTSDGGLDAGTGDGGLDAGSGDGGVDAGADGGTDGGVADGGSDGGTTSCTGHCYDSSGGITFGTPGPWPVGNDQLGAAQGILELPVVGVTTDEAENLWVATNAALYLLKPGQSTFTRFAGRDGLHTFDNPVFYCDNFGPPDSQTVSGTPLPRCVTGQADAPGIISIVGGGPNEVFVGYAATDQWGLMGYSPSSTDRTQSTPHEVVGDWMDPNRHDGKVDRVRIATDHSLIVDRMDFVSYNSAQFWHDKNALHMIFDHFVHPHNLYVGTEHGIDRVLPDNYSMPTLLANGQYTEWFLPRTFPWMGDHLHPRVCFHQWCSDNENFDNQRMGDWFGLAVDPVTGDLWVGGRWSAGKIFWVPTNVDKNPDGTWWINNPDNSPPGAPTPQGWPQRGGRSYVDPATNRSYSYGDRWCGSSGATSELFTDPKTLARSWVPTSCTPGSGTPPVFPVPEEGDPAAISAVAQLPNGDVWWSNAPVNGGDPSYGLARLPPPYSHFEYVSPSSFGMNDNVRDMVALPDGRLALGGDSTGLWLWTPGSSTATHLAGGNGIPGNRVLRLELDRMVNPPTLHVATTSGGARLRQLP